MTAHSPGDSADFGDLNGLNGLTADWSVEAIQPAYAYPQPVLPVGHPSGPLPIPPTGLPAVPPPPPGEPPPPLVPAVDAWPPGARRGSQAFTGGTRRGAGSPVVSVDNNRCHLYAICQMEAPASFELGPDGRLRYDKTPPPQRLPEVQQAARLCPMQAIKLRERS